MITIHEVEQGSQEWLKLRDGLYTGANADKLLSHPDKLKVKDGKLVSYASSEITGFRGNYYTKRGHILETEAIGLFERKNSVNVMVSPQAGFVTNTDYPKCGYSPDGLAGTLLLEVKCFNEKKHMDMYSGNIPFKILAQIHFGLTICGLSNAILLIYNPVFARKFLEDGTENPNYNPLHAYKEIPIAANRLIKSNFKRLLA